MREPGFTASTSEGDTRVSRSSVGTTHWEVALRSPAQPLARVVRELQGYVEQTPAPLQRREFPAPQIVVILEIGNPILVYDSGQERTFSRFAGGFVAGLDDTFTLTEHAGLQTGIQLNLQPLAARQIFAVPLSELRGRAVPLCELLPLRWRDLSDQLRDLPTWQARFELVESFLRDRLSRAAEPSLPRGMDARALGRGAECIGLERADARARLQSQAPHHVVSRSGWRGTEALDASAAVRSLACRAAPRSAHLGGARRGLRLLRPGTPGTRSSPVRGVYTEPATRDHGPRTGQTRGTLPEVNSVQALSAPGV
jgi:hypothetical protein